MLREIFSSLTKNIYIFCEIWINHYFCLFMFTLQFGKMHKSCWEQLGIHLQPRSSGLQYTMLSQSALISAPICGRPLGCLAKKAIIFYFHIYISIIYWSINNHSWWPKYCSKKNTKKKNKQLNVLIKNQCMGTLPSKWKS